MYSRKGNTQGTVFQLGPDERAYLEAIAAERSVSLSEAVDIVVDEYMEHKSENYVEAVIEKIMKELKKDEQ